MSICGFSGYQIFLLLIDDVVAFSNASQTNYRNSMLYFQTEINN